MTTTSAAPPTARRARAGLVILLSAHTLNSFGASMTFVAVPWLVLLTTGSVTHSGAVVAVYAVGSAAAGFLAGPVIDRLGFKQVTALAYLVGGTAMAAVSGLHVRGMLSFGLLLLLVLVAAAADSPGAVAVNGLVPGLARAAGTPLERANSIVRATSSVAQLLGPLLGGVAAFAVGAQTVLLIDALAGCTAAVLVAAVRAPATVRSERSPEGASRGRYLAELRDGLRTIRGTRLLRGLAITGAAYNLLDGGLVGVVLISVAFHTFGNPASFGVMVTAFSVGTLAGTALFGALGHRLPRRPVFIAGSLAMALPLAGFGSAPSLAAAGAALALAGVVAAPVGPLTMSALQEATPPHLFGRVVGTLRVVGAATNPLGTAGAAVAVAYLGTQTTILVMATGYLLIGLACWRAAAFHDLDAARRLAS